MVDPESPINSVPIATPEQSPSTKMDLDVGSPSTEDGAASSSAAAASVIAEPSTDAPPESADSVPTGEVASNEVVDSSERSARTRNRFRGRSYRQRSDSSSSEQNEGRAEDGEQDPDVEAMIRRLVDEMNREVRDFEGFLFSFGYGTVCGFVEQ